MEDLIDTSSPVIFTFDTYLKYRVFTFVVITSYTTQRCHSKGVRSEDCTKCPNCITLSCNTHSMFYIMHTYTTQMSVIIIIYSLSTDITYFMGVRLLVITCDNNNIIYTSLVVYSKQPKLGLMHQLVVLLVRMHQVVCLFVIACFVVCLLYRQFRGLGVVKGRFMIAA